MRLKLALSTALSFALMTSLVCAKESVQDKNNQRILRSDRSDLNHCPSVAPRSMGLKEALDRALFCSPDLVDFQLAYQAAIADTMIANQRPNPNLSLNADTINPHPSASPQGTRKFDSSVRIDQLVELGGKAGYRSEAAMAAEQAAKNTLKYAQKAILTNIEQSYFDALSAQQRAQDLFEISQMNSRVLEVASVRHKVGDLSLLDLKKITLDVKRADNEYQTAKSDLAKAKTNLAQLLGFDRSIGKTEFLKDWPNHEVEIAPIPWERIGERADLQSARNRTESADSSRKLARALRIPDITVGLQYNHQPVSGSPAMGTVNTYSVGVSIPLYVRHAYQGEAKRAEIDYYRTWDAQLRAEKDALTDLLKQESELQVNRDRLIRVLTDILPNAEAVASSAEFAYQKGALGVLDLIDARRSLRIARTEASQLRADYAKSLSAYKLATEIDEK